MLPLPRIFSARRPEAGLLAGDLLRLHESTLDGNFDQDNAEHRYEHLAPEPQALARSGCWITTNSYVNRLPSFVIRVMLLRVSLDTMMLAMVTVGAPKRLVLGKWTIQ